MGVVYVFPFGYFGLDDDAPIEIDDRGCIAIFFVCFSLFSFCGVVVQAVYGVGDEASPSKSIGDLVEDEDIVYCAAEYNAVGTMMENRETQMIINLQDEERDLWSIAECLELNTSLAVLGVYGREISDISPIAKAVEINKTLLFLSLVSNKMVRAASFGKTLRVNHSLQRLVLGGNLTDCGAIGDALKFNATLKDLDLSGNRLKGVNRLWIALQTNNTLKRLWLSNNILSVTKEMTNALSCNTGLKNLRIDGNRISDLTDIAESLVMNKSLTLLDLSVNLCEDLAPLSEALQINATLEILNLEHNPICDHAPVRLWGDIHSFRNTQSVKVFHLLQRMLSARRDFLSLACVIAQTDYTRMSKKNMYQSDGLFCLGPPIATVRSFLWHSDTFGKEIKQVTRAFGNEEAVSEILGWLEEIQLNIERMGTDEFSDEDSVEDVLECECEETCNCFELRRRARGTQEEQVQQEKWDARDEGGLSLEQCAVQLGLLLE